MKATISRNPEARFYDLPKLVDTIDITHVLRAIMELVKLADVVNEHPDNFDATTQAMAYIIRQIKLAVIPARIFHGKDLIIDRNK